MKIVIEFDLSNDAFAHSDQVEDVQLIMRTVEERMEKLLVDGALIIRDINGNMVGEARLEED